MPEEISQEPIIQPSQTPQEQTPFVDVPFDPIRKIDKADISSFLKFPLTPSANPTADYEVANKKYADTAGRGAPGTKVFDGNAPSGVFTDLDLGAVVGANSALVFLKVVNEATGKFYAFRKNGDADIFAGTGASTLSYFYLDTNDVGYTYMVTDASGIIEWYSDGNATKVYVEAYIKLS